MGGGILADALSDLGVSTLLLEAGTLIYRSHITNLTRAALALRLADHIRSALP